MKARLVLLALAVAAVSPPAMAAPVLQLRAVVDCPPHARSRTYGFGDEKLCLAPKIIFDQSDVVDVRKVSTPEGGTAVSITLDDKGSARLRRITTGVPSLTLRLAIVLDGKVIFAPRVAGPLPGKVFWIDADGQSSGIDALLAAFGHRP